MSVLYLLTSPEPVIEGTDAVFQEVSTLKAAFDGRVVNLCPRKVPGRPFPPQLFGFHKLPHLLRLERQSSVTHVYFSVPYYFPVLHLLRKPIVYTVVASLRDRKKPANVRSLRALYRIVVSNERDAAILESWGVSNFAIIPPGINASRLVPHSLTVKDEVTLLMASAPWAEEQFDTKGIDVLLDAVVSLPFLKLILLWRGLLLEELVERVERRGIARRVEIVTRHVDVNDYLSRAHAAVLLAKRTDIVKAYPHSLIESLVAGKPVILTDALPMADYVRRHECGIVLDDARLDSLITAIEDLKCRYDELARHARLITSHAFSEQSMIENYRDLYGLEGT